MEQVDLGDNQRRILSTLVEEHRTTESPVKAATIADELDRSTATIRSQIQSLTALSMVNGIQGPKGGYEPTARAYDALDRQELDDPAAVTLARDFARVDATVDRIDLPDVNDPDSCTARVRFRGDDHGFEVDDAVAIGPTPVSNLLLAGRVVAVDGDDGTVTLDVAELVTPDEAG